MDGKGKFEWPDGRIYVGEYLEDKKHGYGEFLWPGGEKKYEGFWENDQPHGRGILIERGGEKKTGNFFKILKYIFQVNGRVDNICAGLKLMKFSRKLRLKNKKINNDCFVVYFI